MNIKKNVNTISSNLVANFATRFEEIVTAGAAMLTFFFV